MSYLYWELDKSEPTSISKEEILDRFWPSWRYNMENKYGVGHYLITEDNCIEDWCISNWAWKESDKYLSNLQQDGDDSVLILPPELLLKLGWSIGDTLSWKVDDLGRVVLEKP